ncbi:MAG: hypothetical protein Q4C63_04955 [Eubacteriales bacterium]|nr:hypothetical protein [Eubacteriales bacterium]
MDLKKIYRRLLPVSKEAFHNDTEKRNKDLQDLKKQLEELKQQQKEEIKQVHISQQQCQELLEKYQQALEEIRLLTAEGGKKLEQMQSAQIQNTETIRVQYEKMLSAETQGQELIKKNTELIQRVGKENHDASRFAKEAVWADVYHDTVAASEWLKEKTFSPGRWAIGYPVLYTLYRVLDEFKPKNILELGLGQSTKLISQYVASHEDVMHKVVEHDESWIEFFKNGNTISERTQIIHKQLDEMTLNDKEHIRCYKNFAEGIMPGKYDLIFIDAPIGWDMKDYSRVDVLTILEECLPTSFVIMMDDSQRSGEKQTITLLEKRLQEMGIEYETGVYNGEKQTFMLTSKKDGFLCSM